MKLQEIEGILNFVGKSSNFFDDYELMGRTDLFCRNPELINTHTGIVIQNAKGDRCVKAEVSLRSFLNLKAYFDTKTYDIPTIHDLCNSINSFYDIETVAGVVTGFFSGLYSTCLILVKDGRFFISSAQLTDVICLQSTKNIPLYMRRSIIDTYGFSTRISVADLFK